MSSNEQKKEAKKSEEALTSAGIASEKPSQSQRSVYDFLYHDARRIGSFLSQLNPYGLLQGIKANESASRTSSGAVTNSGTSKIPGFMDTQSVRGQTVSDSETDAAERTYDPLWANARSMLNYLSENEMLVSDAETARIGQFVLITGSLAVFDMTFMETIWGNRILRDKAIDTLAKGVENAEGHPPKKHREIVSSLLDFVRALPHTIQMGVMTSNSFFWGNLSEQNLVTSPTDLLLKNGGQLPGEWTVLGILDALAEDEQVEEGHQSALNSLGAFGGIAAHFVPSIRTAVGRPQTAFGVTPILIFREVYGAPKKS